MKISVPEQPVRLRRYGARAAPLVPARPAAMLLACAAFVACWLIAGGLRTAVDYPLIRTLNAALPLPPDADLALAWVTTYYLFTGVLFMALIWYCWFACPDARARAAVLCGTVAAFLAGIAGRLLQLALPTHARPLHDAALGMTFGAIDPAELNHWSAFPSDHAAVQFGLAAVVLLLRRRLGVAALTWAALLNLVRVHLGVHYPTDVLGGAALGVLAVLLAQGVAAGPVAAALPGWERRAPGGFYAVAFFLSYNIATLFDEARTGALATLRLLRHLLGHGGA